MQSSNDYTAIALPSYEDIIEGFLASYMTFPVVVNDESQMDDQEKK